MKANPQGTPRMAGSQEQAIIAQLRNTFQSLPNDIDLYLFAEPGADDVFAQAIRQVVRAFRELTDRIRFREYPLDHDLAAQYGISSGPTLAVSPDRYRILWSGAPIGEESKTFLEMLLLVGAGQSQLSESALTVLDRLETPRRLKIFVSPSCPYCPQEAINAVKAVIARPELVSLEIIDIQARPDVAEQYSAHSVPQAFANDVLIGMGAQSEELFVASVQKLEPVSVFIPDSDAARVDTDLVVVGGGPAGLTAGIYAVRAGLKTAVIERDALGGQVALTPVVENYPGFTQVGGKTLVDIMVTHALEYVDIYPGEEVISIDRGDRFTIQTSRRTFTARTLLLATGASHKRLGVPGEDRLSGHGVSYCATCDGPLFKGKRVIMVGGGNSAVTEALHLYHQGVDVTLIHRRDALRAQDVLANNLSAAGVPVKWNTAVSEIQGKDRVTAVVLTNTETGVSETVPMDGVFIAIGYTPVTGLAERLGVALTDEGYIAHDEKHRTNVPGVYSAGDVEGGYKQIVTATGQGSAAAMTIFEDLINPYWKRDKVPA